MADPMLAWNDPNVPQSSLQIYLANGGDPARAAEFLYAGGAQGATTLDRVKDFTRQRTPEELQARRDMENSWTSNFLASPVYNPNGANSYAIQNFNNTNTTQNPTSGFYESNVPLLSTISNPATPETRKPVTPTLGNNQAETGTSNVRNSMRRSDSAAYSGAPQYTQSASLGNQNPYLSGMYQAQNLNNNGLGLSLPNGTTSAGPSRGTNFSKALWR